MIKVLRNINVLSKLAIGGLMVFSCNSREVKNSGPYLATGIRIGDVTQNETIIWVRLTHNSERVNNFLVPTVLYKDPETGSLENRSGRQDKEPVVLFPEGVTRNEIEGAVPGAPGMVREKHWIHGIEYVNLETHLA